MRLLRGVQQSTKVTAFILLAFVAASFLTITSPRPTFAEGPSLLGTVRCLVRTVLAAECQQASPSAPSVAPQATQTPPTSNQSAPVSPQPTDSKQPVAPGTTRSPQTLQGVSYPEVQEITLPTPIENVALDIQQVRVNESGGKKLSNAEYLAYFNKYSPYAVAGAQQQAQVTAPLSRTSEGWRVLGISWYWWVLAMGLVGVIGLSVRRVISRRSIQLSLDP